MNHLALLIVNITVVLSFLSSEGSATGCDGLYEKHQSFELEDKYEAFFDQARLASEKTKELFKFLKDNKVTISSTIHLPEPTFIVSKVGRHPKSVS